MEFVKSIIFTISDIKEGNVVTLYNKGGYYIYIIANYRNLSKYFRNAMATDSEIVLIRFDTESTVRFSYFPFNSFYKRFPKHNHWSDIEIIGVYNASIDIKSVKNEDDLKKLWDYACDFIGNSYI